MGERKGERETEWPIYDSALEELTATGSVISPKTNKKNL